MAVLAAAAIGCTDSTGTTSPAGLDAPSATAQPSIGPVAVRLDSTNALAARVVFTVQHTDSARVLYRINGGAERAISAGAVHDSAQVPLLGLPAEATITARVVAMAAAGSDTSASVTTTLAAAPDIYRRVQLQTTTGHLSGGYVLVSLNLGDTAYAAAFDTTGHVAWYHAFPGAIASSDAFQQPNGDITIYLGTSHGWDPVAGYYAEIRPTGDVVREWRTPTGYYTDPHELRVDASDGASYFFGYDIRATDLTSRGGSADSLLAGHTIFRVDAAGNTTPIFAARDHFTIADWVIPPDGLGDFDHPNSLDIDHDGDLIVSWRNIGEVSKIDPHTGQFVWRLGGPQNQFTFVNDPLGGFGGQHFARVLPNGDLLLYDNGWTHTPNETRAAEYRLDLAAHTATLVWQFRHQPALFTPFVGSVQRLASGNTFIAYADEYLTTEVDAGGSVVWEGKFLVDGTTPTFTTYRFLKIASLTAYEAP